MGNKEETVTIQIPESFTFGNYEAEDFDRVLSFFDWNLKYQEILINKPQNISENPITLLFLAYIEFIKLNNCNVGINFGNFVLKTENLYLQNWDKVLNSVEIFSKKNRRQTLVIHNSVDREKALEFGRRYTENLDIEYEKTIRYVLNELLYNTLEHGKNETDLPSLLQFIWKNDKNEFAFIVADIGVGIRKHLRQTYPNLATDSEAILHSIKPQISGTFGRQNTGYETKNNAGVGLFFSSNIAQRLNADMFIVSGNGFVHISPTEIISKELEHQWKGTFVYVKIKLGLIEDLNLQKMLSEITKSIPKTEKVTTDNNLYISVRNYFGRYAEDKDLAKKIRDEKLIPALAENKSLTIDFEEIVSAPHSLLNAMLATPIERLGLAAYKKIKIINAAPEIRETLDFIFDDNTSNA